MANEITLRSSLQIRQGSLFYQSQPSGFNANMAGSRGPSPGYLTAKQPGTPVDLSQLAKLGGWAVIYNMDPADGRTSFLEVCVYDPDTNELYPFAELLPGENFPIRLSRYLGSEFGLHTGTGPTGSGVKLYLKGVGADVGARVDAFDA